jgi:peptide-methionine (R)-S-oxide reductase
MPISAEQARRLAIANAVARCGVGVAAIVAPALPLRPWIGDAADTPAARLLARPLGGRDLALGLGVLFALRHEAPARGWLEGAALADASDAAATVIAFGSLPRAGRWLVLAAAMSGAATAALAARAVEG